MCVRAYTEAVCTCPGGSGDPESLRRAAPEPGGVYRRDQCGLELLLFVLVYCYFKMLLLYLLIVFTLLDIFILEVL